MNPLDQIPHQDLVFIIRELTWYSWQVRTDKQGYSLEVRLGTAARDALYRNVPLYATPDEALLRYWGKYLKPRTQPKTET